MAEHAPAPWEQRMRHIIGNPKLSKVMSEDFIDAFREIDRLRDERDELLAACKAMRRLVGDAYDCRGAVELEMADEAIAKAEWRDDG